MNKRILAVIIAVVMAFSAISVVNADTTEITQYEYFQDFENYTVQSNQNSIVNIGESDDSALVIKRTELSVDNVEKLTLDTVISEDVVELEFLLLPRETAGEKAEAYLQLFQGSSNARLNVKISCDNGDLNRYRIKVGSKEVITKDELYHLPKNAADDGENFTKENFNKIKMVLHRVVVDGNVNNDLSMFYVYLNGELKGEYTFAEIGTGGIGYSAGKTIESVRMYQYKYDTGLPLDEEVYFDDITVRGKSVVEYDASMLEMAFDASMNYTSEESKLVINGTDSEYLEQTYSVNLINAEDEADITEVAVFDAEKADDGSAIFAFNEAITVNPGWYFASVQRIVGGEEKGSAQSHKIYIATTEQLSSLPGDFSTLPENDEEAQELIRYYLPCFLTEEEIIELLPEKDGTLTQKANENLAFITSYFKEKNAIYTEINEVHTEFLKAKGYLELKNAETTQEIIATLENGNYLADYSENPVYIEYNEEFYTHFETKRTDNENPLVSDEKIEKALRYAMAMTSLNNAERSGIEGIVEEYNEDIFSLDLEKVTEENKDSLYSALYNKIYTTLDTVRADWEDAVNSIPETPELPPELEEEEKHPSGGSSGGSSGGGGGGGSFGGSISKKDNNDTLAPKIEPTDVVIEEKPEETEITLTDISEHWAEKEITALCEKGYITGFEDNTFRPGNKITRAELVTILGRILPDADSESEIEFSDVKENDWYYASVKKAVSLGIAQGADGKFMPHDYITREQLAVMVYRAVKVDENAEIISFEDADTVSEYAKDAVAYLYDSGIITGYEDNTFRPQNPVTRAEAAKILYGLFAEI